MNWRSRLVRALDMFALDLRSLAVFRVALGCLILSDLAWRLVDLRAHHTDSGVLPRAVLLETGWNEWWFSFHLFSGNAAYQGLIFLVAAVFAAMMVVGYRTRLATVASWVLLISIQNRNPMILQGGDVFFRMILFFGMFLPLGSRFSLDVRAGREAAHPSGSEKSMASAAYILQIVMIYVFSAVIKSSNWSWTGGSAVYYAFMTYMYSTSFAQWFVSHFVEATRWMTKSTVWFEAGLPLLLFIPFKNSWFRLGVSLAFIGLHLSFGLTLTVGFFIAVGVVGWIPLIPGFFWEKLGARLPQTSQTPPSTKGKRKLFFVFREVFLAYVVVYVFFINAATVKLWGRENWLSPRAFGSALRLDQYWNMFSSPIIEDGWYVFSAKLQNGSSVDVWNKGKPLSWDPPESVSETYRRQRVKKYLFNLYASSGREHLIHLGRWVCRDWNSTHAEGETLLSFRVVYMRQDTLPMDKPGKAPVQRLDLWNHECFLGMFKQYPPEI